MNRAKKPERRSGRRISRRIFSLAIVLVVVAGMFALVPFAPPVDGSPAWSPDGTKIVFSSERDGNSEIYVMGADGSSQTRITHNPASDGHPNFSPDGTRILFDSDRAGNFDIFLMNVDGSNAERLTHNPARDVAASWSPEGRKIAFMSDRTGEFDIWAMSADGSNPKRLTDFGTNWFPRWSPAGTKIAYHVGRDIHVLDVNESRFARLTIDPDNGMYPVWSPDGQRIVFMSWRAGPTEIFVMNADGSNQERLTETSTGDVIDPQWSPDGQRVVFVHVPRGLEPEGPKVIYLMNADGTNIQRLSRWWFSLETLGYFFTSPFRTAQAKDGHR